MLVPKQSKPIIRKTNKVQLSVSMSGVHPSNWKLQCDLCCANGGGEYCNDILPGCLCTEDEYPVVL